MSKGSSRIASREYQPPLTERVKSDIKKREANVKKLTEVYKEKNEDEQILIQKQ